MNPNEDSAYMFVFDSASDISGDVPVEDENVLRNINSLLKYEGYGVIGIA